MYFVLSRPNTLLATVSCNWLTVACKLPSAAAADVSGADAWLEAAGLRLVTRVRASLVGILELMLACCAAAISFSNYCEKKKKDSSSEGVTWMTASSAIADCNETNAKSCSETIKYLRRVREAWPTRVVCTRNTLARLCVEALI